MTERELAKLFRAERAAFAATYPRALRCSLVLLDARCPLPPCAPRDLAACDVDTGEIQLARRALSLPRANLVAILRHELGHAVDPWPTRRGAERRADRIAESVRGAPIHYDAQLVQTIDPRAPHKTRPASLPR